ncbi:MAG: FkbM family methyltransferase [Methanolinea sp.]|nr:FkbM family methyltransferase [Methanolinea sp.]
MNGTTENVTFQLFQETLTLLDKRNEDIKKFPTYSSDIPYNILIRFINRFLSKIHAQILILPEKDSFVVNQSIGLIKDLLLHYSEYDTARSLLADEKSKNIFDWMIRYRIAYAFIGGQALYLIEPPISPKIYKGLKEQTQKLKIYGKYQISGLKFKSNDVVFIPTWLLGQYQYRHRCEPKTGDTVLDIGACEGETSLWFAQKIDNKGCIFAFEPEINNFRTLQENIKSNSLQNLIIPIQIGLWSSRKTLSFSGSGGGFSYNESGKNQIEVITLDDFIIENNIGKVDFIKMDVEGSEMEILQGAEKTIKKYKPKCAIAVYHKFRDIIEIINFLHGIVPDYRFYLAHFTTNYGETILFANSEYHQ